MGDEDVTGEGSSRSARQGWIIFCPDENSQLGDPFWDSDEASKVAKAHNNAERHNANIQPYWD